MIKLLTDEIEKKLNRITLDYVFFTPRDYVTKTMQGFYSFEEIEHYRILKQWAYQDVISSAYEVIEYLENKRIRDAMEYYAFYKDMLLQIPKSGGNLIHTPIIYFHEDLSDTQKIRLHLWVEYFQKLQSDYCFRRYSKDQKMFLTDHYGEEVNSTLDRLDIFDDFEEKRLIRNVPNYEELNR